MREVVEDVYIDPDIQRYIVNLVGKTRKHRQVELGVSPRGSLALLKLSRAWAAIHERDYVIPDDIKILAPYALGHRLILDPSLWGSKKAEKAVIEDVIQSVPVPVTSRQHEFKAEPDPLVIILRLFFAALVSRNGAVVLLRFPFMAFLAVAMLDSPGNIQLQASRRLSSFRSKEEEPIRMLITIENHGSPIPRMQLSETARPKMDLVDGALEQRFTIHSNEKVELHYTFNAPRGTLSMVQGQVDRQ